MRPWLVAIAAGFLVAGCATTPPVKTMVRQSPSYDTATPPNVDQLGVLVDADVEYDAVSGKFIDVADSRMAIAQLAEQTKSALSQKGYTVDFAVTPFVGGFREDPSYSVAQDRHGYPKPMAPPFAVDDSVASVKLITLRNVSEGVMDAFANQAALLSDTHRWKPAARDALAQVAANDRIRYLLVVQGHGLIESGWKQAAEGVGTAALTALATLGTVAISVRQVSWLDSFVVLIDLQTSEILWSNTLRFPSFDPGDPKEYKNDYWSRQILYYLPPRGNSEKTSAK